MDKPTGSKRKGTGFAWIAAIAVVVVLFLWVLLGWFASTQPDPEKFGEMFGASNALFSGLAFAILIATLHSQREELESQQDELALQRQELHETRKVFERQRFESTFFHLVAVFQSVVSELELGKGDARSRVGRACFEDLLSRLRDAYLGIDGAGSDDARRMQEAYQRFYVEHDYLLGPYFRVLHNVLRYIHESQLDDKKIFANIVRAQLSSFEVALLFYNSLTPHGKGIRTYIDCYKLLKHLPDSRLIEPSHAAWITPSARGTAAARP
jgi:hypothetical protein